MSTILGRSALENEIWFTKDIEIDAKSTFSLVRNKAFKVQNSGLAQLYPYLTLPPIISTILPNYQS
jgi:hypothetical protein